MNAKNIIRIALLCLVSISCDNMNSMHQEYLDKGEVIYAKKIDSVKSYPGSNRVKLEIFLDTFIIKSFSIKGAEMSGVDTLVTDVGSHVVDNKIEVIVEDVPGGDNILSICSYDLYENSSLPVEIFTTCYGKFYQESLQDRMISSQSNNSGLYELTFFSSTEQSLIETEIEYTMKDGIGGLVIVEADNVGVVTLPQIDISKSCRYRSKFLPDINAIDVLYSNYTIIDPALWNDK
ncbi:MAG: DUF4998 domain-containing protein [Bacteroidales bacterium]